MSQQPANAKPEILVTVVKIVAAIAIVALFLSPPIKQWLNAQPIRLRVLYPLLAFICGYGLFQAVRAGSGSFDVLRWGIILASSVSSVLAVFGMGSFFFTVARMCAFAFIALEIGRILYEGFAGSQTG